MRVLLIAGGWSNEREVSLSGAVKIRSALEGLGHEVDFLDPALEFKDLLARAGRCGFAFINLHGMPGEDGLIQGMLDAVGCPYQGASAEGSFLALNKAAAKSIFEAAGIPTPAWELVSLPPEGEARTGLRLPVFVKPVMGGSSLGMTLVRRMEELGPALRTVFAMGQAALVEEFTPGVEVTCGILGETALPLILIKPKSGEFFDYRSKYLPGGAEEVCPAPVEAGAGAQIQGLTLSAHKALGLTGYSRGDFILGEGGPMLLEMNTLPGMTPTSLLPQAAEKAGYPFERLIEKLMELGLADRGRGRS